MIGGTTEIPIAATAAPSNTQTSIGTNNDDENFRSLFDYNTARERIQRMINAFANLEGVESERRRKVRDIRVSREELIMRGILKPDETFIPIRLCDTNIRREQPPFVSFLKQSRRLAIFRCINNPNQDTQELEKAFTEGMTYDAWEVAHFKTLDGAMVHGWDAMEIEFDIDKPLHVGLNHMGHERLMFPLDAKDIQKQEQIAIEYEVNALQLRQYIEGYGFDEEQVNKVIDLKTSKDHDATVKIYKIYSKYQGVVYVAWYSKEVDDWLKAPAKLYLGVQKQVTEQIPQQQLDPITQLPVTVMVPSVKFVDEEETQYPIEVLYYSECEKPLIRDHKGRVYLDEYKQEAASCTWSNFINGCNRAAGIYASPANATSGAAPKQTDTIIGHGRVYNEPLNFWHMDYPDPVMLKAVQSLDVQNSNETNQPNFAVQNREDSRKTATEITAAQEERGLLNSVQVTLYSTFLRRVYSRVWRIVQSQAMQQKITFMPMPDGSGNNLQVIGQQYDVRAAGDVDVVQRQEKLQRLLQFFSLTATTPLGFIILQDAVKLAFPEDGEKYIALLNQALQLQQQAQQQQQQQMQQQMPMQQQHEQMMQQQQQ